MDFKITGLVLKIRFFLTLNDSRSVAFKELTKVTMDQREGASKN